MPNLKSLLFVILFLVIALGLFEPLEENLSRLADLLAGLDIDVFLAGLGAPFLENFFGEEIIVVAGEEDLGGLVEEIGVLLAAESNEAFDASKEGLLVLLGGTNLGLC